MALNGRLSDMPGACLYCFTAITRHGAKTLLLGLGVAVLAAAAADAAVTVYNPAGLLVDILVDDQTVQVTTEMVTLNITEAQQHIQFKVPDGETMEVNVQDGDVLVLIPDPNDPLHAVLALRLQLGGAQLLTPLAAPLVESLLPPAAP